MTQRQERLRRFSALIRKETLQLIRDPSSILIAFVLPLVLLFLFGYGVSLDAPRTPIGLVLEGEIPAARELAATFSGSPYFSVQEGVDRRLFGDALAAGDLRGIVVIPREFGEGQVHQVQVIVDGTDPNSASFVQAYARGAVASWQAEMAARQGLERVAPLQVEQRVWFNPEVDSRNFLLPGSIAIVMTLIGTLLTALVVAREWERGTMEAMMATSVTGPELLLGKLVPYFLLALISMGLCVGITVWLFGVPFRGSGLALICIVVAFLLPALGQGLLISAATKNQFLASQVALITGFLPALLLSGFLFEIPSMPAPIRALSAIVPARYLIPSLQTVFLTGDVWPLFLRGIGIHLIQGAILFATAARSTRKQLA